MKKTFLALFTGSVLLLTLSCGDSATFKVLGSPTLASATASVNATTFYGSPTFEEVTLYTVWLSQNADCTELVQVSDYGTDGQKFNMFDNPTLFEGSPADGTYRCMVIKLLDTMSFKPEESDGTGVCVAGETYSYDVARGDDEETWVDENFDPITISSGANIVYIFATTDAAAAEANNVSTHQIIDLTSPLTVPGEITLAIDFTDKVYIYDSGSAERCWLEKPTMAFK